MADPSCPACGVPYRDHLGLNGTCQALREARDEVDRRGREIARLRDALLTAWAEVLNLAELAAEPATLDRLRVLSVALIRATKTP